MRLFWAIAIAILAGLAPVIAPAAEPLRRSVLIFDQSEPNSPWGNEFRATLRSTLSADLAAPVVIYSEVLDLTRFHTKEYEELLRTSLRSKYRDKPIGVIVVHGSLALDILMRLRAELWSTVPVVFGAVDQPTIARLNLPPDVTGTTMQLQLGNSINAARVLVPNLRRVALVGDPFERQAFRRHYSQEVPQFAKEFEIIDLLGLPMAKLRARVAALPNDTAIIYTSIYIDDEGVTYIPRDALTHVAQAANRPIVGEAEPLIGYGVTGGFVAVPQPIAETSARLVLRILSGEKASDIPISTENFTKPIFDWRQLQRFGINENRLPPGSEVRFRVLTVWEQYRWQIMLIAAVLLIQTALIIGLIYEHRYRRAAEAASRNAMGKLAHMNRVATAGELSASIAHEVNQPLAAIVANASAALRWLSRPAPDLDEARAALNGVVSDGHRASEVIGSVSAMFKKGNEARVSLDLNDLIQEVFGHVSVELQTQGITVQKGLSRPLPLVYGNSGQLQQVILNLVRNAVDAMNSVSGRVRVLRVESAVSDSDSVLVSVEDSGTGIDPKDVGPIFDSFFTTKSDGMGMGLSICRSIIEAHGGQIWVDSVVGQGSTFCLTLPIQAREHSKALQH